MFHFSTHCASVDRRPRKISIDDWKELEKKTNRNKRCCFYSFPDATNTLNKMAVFLCTHFIDQRIINPGKYFGLLTMFASTYISAGVFCRTSWLAVVSSKSRLLSPPYTSIQAINFLFSFFFSFISVFLPYYIQCKYFVKV